MYLAMERKVMENNIKWSITAGVSRSLRAGNQNTHEYVNLIGYEAAEIHSDPCVYRVSTPANQRVRTPFCWCLPEITWAWASSLCSAASGPSASPPSTCHMRWGHTYARHTRVTTSGVIRAVSHVFCDNVQSVLTVWSSSFGFSMFKTPNREKAWIFWLLSVSRNSLRVSGWKLCSMLFPW